ncbi:hypothetical protein U1Q18_032473 [Sarracenia purpurea var. burkii]
MRRQMPQIALQPPPAVNRWQPLPGRKRSPTAVKDERLRVGEVAGGTAAECAAICCCVPFALMNLVVLAVYKVPTGMCQKAWKWKKEKKNRRWLINKKKTLLQQPTPPAGANSRFDGWEINGFGSDGDGVECEESTADGDFETEMWDRFRGTGFWRSPSQREVQR